MRSNWWYVFTWWGALDAVTILPSVIVFAISEAGNSSTGQSSGLFAAMRLLRVLRILRLQVRATCPATVTQVAGRLLCGSWVTMSLLRVRDVWDVLRRCGCVEPTDVPHSWFVRGAHCGEWVWGEKWSTREKRF